MKRKSLLQRIKDWLFELLQSQCLHTGSVSEDLDLEWYPTIKADILEGDAQGFAVQWCQHCGAYRVVYRERQYTGWRKPRATWD